LVGAAIASSLSTCRNRDARIIRIEAAQQLIGYFCP
jgi:hypothetical protein